MFGTFWFTFLCSFSSQWSECWCGAGSLLDSMSCFICQAILEWSHLHVLLLFCNICSWSLTLLVLILCSSIIDSQAWKNVQRYYITLFKVLTLSFPNSFKWACASNIRYDELIKHSKFEHCNFQVCKLVQTNSTNDSSKWIITFKIVKSWCISPAICYFRKLLKNSTSW